MIIHFKLDIMKAREVISADMVWPCHSTVLPTQIKGLMSNKLLLEVS